MKNKKIFYKDINFIRIVSCLAILLYHLGILKGGYLAVCTFFVMSGFLSSISAFKKEKFSLKSYYLNRLKKIYIPFVIVATSQLAQYETGIYVGTFRLQQLLAIGSQLGLFF